MNKIMTKFMNKELLSNTNFLTGVCVATVLAMLLASSFASEKVNINLDGKLIPQTQSMGYAYVNTKSSRTMVPLRLVTEKMGYKVTWNKGNQTVIIQDGDTTINIAVNSTKPTVNGVTKTIDAPAVLQGDRTYVPIRFISEAMGEQVAYKSNTVYISTNGKAPVIPEQPTQSFVGVKGMKPGVKYSPSQVFSNAKDEIAWSSLGYVSGGNVLTDGDTVGVRLGKIGDTIGGRVLNSLTFDELGGELHYTGEVGKVSVIYIKGNNWVNKQSSQNEELMGNGQYRTYIGDQFSTPGRLKEADMLGIAFSSGKEIVIIQKP